MIVSEHRLSDAPNEVKQNFLCMSYVSSYAVLLELSVCIPKEVSGALPVSRKWDSAWTCRCMQELHLC